jgi:hypothetical protein
MPAAPGGGSLGGQVEPQLHLVVGGHLGGQEERRLALHHLLHGLLVSGQAFGQGRQPAGVLQQSLEAQVLGGVGDEVDDALPSGRKVTSRGPWSATG